MKTGSWKQDQKTAAFLTDSYVAAGMEMSRAPLLRRSKGY